MDVFSVRDQLVDDYRDFTGSFVAIHESRVREHVEQRTASDYQWPDPWLSLNPNFAAGGSVTELVEQGVLDPECERIFRIKADPGDADGPVLRLHRHQQDAVQVAGEGHSYVLTTGTGSGKSLTYLIPIVNRVLRARREGSWRPGVKAIVVYPMNALANSQLRELTKFLRHGYPGGAGPVSFERYTGQEGEQERARILKDPPDILLTNYVMLELVLTRPKERGKLIEAARGLWFLVLDELHTYRGRQGADVALLARRVREACQAPDVQCVGTSATMTSQGSHAEQRQAVGQVATRLFGVPVAPEHVIDETLQRVTAPATGGPGDLARRVRTLAAGPWRDPEYGEFVHDPLAAWVETTLGLEEADRPSQLWTRRRSPLTLTGAAAKLAAACGEDAGACRAAIEAVLQAGAAVRHPDTQRPVFAFRLHQFLSKGDNVYVTLEPPATRHVTSQYQAVAPGEGPRRTLFPLAFCRECGQDYLIVSRIEEGDQVRYAPRQDSDGSGGDAATGYLYISDDRAWPELLEQAISETRLPYSWVEDGRLVSSKQKYLPAVVRLDVEGRPDGDGCAAAYVPSPLQFCLRCRVSYEQARSRDFAKLAKLSVEGRSSAMSLVSASAVRALRAAGDRLVPQARKLLTFVDNRQDASLQAGHFNDFVQVTQLRGALYRALQRSGGGLRHEEVAARVTEALGLELADFARNPEAKFGQKDQAGRALREVVGYRLYLDLERGWRVTMPNLEQCGLLKIDYADLAEICRDDPSWEGMHVALREDRPEHRQEVAATLLDELRRNLAIDVPALTEEGFSVIHKLSGQHLAEPWKLPERERPPEAGVAFPGPGGRGGRRGRDLFISGRSAYGRYLTREYRGVISGHAEAQEIIQDLLELLSGHGLVTEAVPGTHERPAGYRLLSSAIVWRVGDGSEGVLDRVRLSLDNERGPRVNPFFVQLYRETAVSLSGLRAKEHTAQVTPEDRQQREQDFGQGDLPVLYCSPTMELGVDIPELVAVGLRNVPPTPANYAQRAGRAGRSGQPALVVTYCATGSAHDQYYFRRGAAMVGGSVAPPRLDVANEDLVRFHVQAVWLAETDQDLGRSLADLLDLSGERPSLEILPDVCRNLRDPAAQRAAARRARATLADILPELRGSPWWRDDWVDMVVAQASAEFESACQRWRVLYRTALAEYEQQTRRAVDGSVPLKARNHAAARARDARIQLNLLRNEDSEYSQTDFYSYRYFASEGFLPGYSFPRLPLAAYVPGLPGRREGDFIQRPRFIGISEFGPGALIYHEGTRYEVTSVTLPPSAPGQEGITTESARPCGECGYLNDDAVGIDTCDHCGARLRQTQRRLLRLHTVRTTRKERISSDEEERRRSSFEIHTSYRFHAHGARPDRLEAAAGAPALLHLSYGDSATVRRTNLGRTRRKNRNLHGYLVDLTTGRWLRESEADDPGDDDTPGADDVKRKERVIPYVEDRRNILVTRLADPVDEPTAVSLAYALERGIEATFQLEDAELTSELLPDPAGRARILFVESAEGGAGVLRRLVQEKDKLAQAARTALDICHFDPDTGADTATADGGGREPCRLGCYDCLLSYANQRYHAAIDRHLVRDLLLRLAGATVTITGQPQPRQPAPPAPAGPGGRAAELVAWLRTHGHREPDGSPADAGTARPDLVYHLDHGSVAVFVDDPEHDEDRGDAGGRDAEAQEALLDAGWTVIQVRHTDRFETVVGKYPSVFGPRKQEGPR
jgi:superfamily II DNA/RNA helicase